MGGQRNSVSADEADKSYRKSFGYFYVVCDPKTINKMMRGRVQKWYKARFKSTGN